MRKIQYTNKFKKLYSKLTPELQDKTKKTINLLQNNPFPIHLKTHKLSWRLYKYHSCSIDYSNRIIFEILDDWTILLLLIWNHSIYKI
jgi:mRNA-degrading endonuclease YafQ of YafQ-DinJ toxin-antitoxin module